MGDDQEAVPAATTERPKESAAGLVRGGVLDAGTAELAGWVVLALSNQALIALKSPETKLATRAAYHAFDFGQLTALGIASFVAIWASWRLFERAAASLQRFRAAIRAGAFALLVFGVGVLTMEGDVQNFADRHGLSHDLAVVSASAVFSLLLTATLVLRRITGAKARAALLLAGVGLAVLNGSFLESDYFAAHLMTAWFAARLVASALSGVRLALPRPALLGSLAVLFTVAAVSLVVRPSHQVQRALHRVPSSVLAPLWSRLLPNDEALDDDLVPARHRESPWFRDRRSAVAVPPSRALTPPDPAVVFFFTVDALRADLLSRDDTVKMLPELSALRRESVYFTQARSPTPSTFTSGAAIFAGRHFSQLEWARNEKGKLFLAEREPRFTELLQGAGVRTLNVMGVTLGQLDAANGALRGFDVELRPSKTKPPGRDVISKIISDLPRIPSKSTLYYTHFIEPHVPYDLAGKHGTPFERYLREVALVDQEIGRLREHVRKVGLEKHAIFIIAADHGEAFGEHGTTSHALNVYEEAVHVPLIVHVPGVPPREVDVPVSVIDVGPTLLDLFGVPVPGSYMGQSLLPLIAGKPAKLLRPVVVDSGRRLQAFYFDDGKKVIFDLNQQTTEVYDLVRDPGERENLVDSGAPGVAEAIATAKLYFHTHEFRAPGYKQPWLKF